MRKHLLKAFYNYSIIIQLKIKVGLENDIL